jgi:hypothetical protein
MNLTQFPKVLLGCDILKFVLLPQADCMHRNNSLLTVACKHMILLSLSLSLNHAPNSLCVVHLNTTIKTEIIDLNRNIHCCIPLWLCNVVLESYPHLHYLGIFKRTRSEDRYVGGAPCCAIRDM